MEIDFNNISDHLIPLKDFRFNWRFVDFQHIDKLKPLDVAAAQFLDNFISKSDMHADLPFKKSFFLSVDSVKIYLDNEQEIKKWLYNCGLPLDKNVFLSWDNKTAMIVPYKLLIKYFDIFYSGGDDLTVIDDSMQWSLLFHHEDEVYFGTNTKYKLSGTSEDINFILDKSASR